MPRLRSPYDAWLDDRPMEQSKGLHQDLFTAAAFLFEKGHSAQDIFRDLRDACDKADYRFVPDREIYSAMDYAHRRVTGEAAPGVIWPAHDLAFRVEILNLHPTDMAKLRAKIPARLSTLAYLHSMYREDNLLCIGKTATEFRTVRLCDIPADNRDLSMCEFINPSPMTSVAGLTADEEWSEHAKSNTGPRVYSVIEFDMGEPREHASILKYLATRLPLMMIVYSGSTSLHGWFKTSHADEPFVEKFYKEAVMLGADPKMFSPCQFSRLPMGTNARTGRTQRVIFFNPRHVYYE